MLLTYYHKVQNFKNLVDNSIMKNLKWLKINILKIKLQSILIIENLQIE